MGNSMTALAPLGRATQRTYLAKPKPAASMIIQNLIESIEGLKNALAVQSIQQPTRYVPSRPVQTAPAAPEPVEVRQIRTEESSERQVKVNRGSLLDFFD
jgi:hypothetical protein